MIYPLFQNAWSLYPTATPNFKTGNHSAIRLATTLKRMGVKNHLLPLYLIDQSLLDIDPHSPLLTLIDKARVITECKRNPWYFFREVLKAPASSGGKDGWFKFSRGNFAMFWFFFNHITTINIWPRQRGKSFSSDCLALFLLNIACTDTSMQLLTKDDHLRSVNIKRIRNIDSSLPSYITKQNKYDTRNSTEFTVNVLNNGYKGHLPSTSPKRAYLVGRGLTSPIFFIDEPCYQSNISISLTSALSSGVAAREMAAEAGAPYGTVLTTTAGKQDDRDGKYIYKMLKDSAVMSESFYDQPDLESLEKTVRSAGHGKLRVNCTFNHRQLGITDQALAKAIEESAVEGEDMLRDFYNVWTNSTESSPFTMEVANKLANGRVDPIWVQSDGDHYTTRWYVSKSDADAFMEAGECVMGLDTSDAIGNDDIGLILRHLVTGRVIAVGTYNTTNIITFSKWLFDVWFKPYPRLVAIIERRSTASSIIDYLLLMLHQINRNPFKQLFNWCFHKEVEMKNRYELVYKYAEKDLHVKYKRFVGFSTSGSGATSRTGLYSDTLLSTVNTSGGDLADTELTGQLLGLVIRNNRVDHQVGGNDDLVISLLLTTWFMMNTPMKSYGINPLSVLSRVPDAYDDNEEVKATRRQDEGIRADIDKLIESYSEVSHPLLAKQFKRKLYILTNQLTNDTETYNFDALLEKMKTLKKFKHDDKEHRVSKLNRIRRNIRLRSM